MESDFLLLELIEMVLTYLKLALQETTMNSMPIQLEQDPNLQELISKTSLMNSRLQLQKN